MNQTAIDFAKAAGEAGMQRAADHAERVTPGWIDLAYSFVIGRCRLKAKTDIFTAEDFVDAYTDDACFIQPPDERAFGAVTKRAIREGIIKVVDGEGRRRKGHGTRCSRYKSLVAGKRATEIHARAS